MIEMLVLWFLCFVIGFDLGIVVGYARARRHA